VGNKPFPIAAEAEDGLAAKRFSESDAQREGSLR
jgi:hypothetical protein